MRLMPLEVETPTKCTSLSADIRLEAWQDKRSSLFTVASVATGKKFRRIKTNKWMMQRFVCWMRSISSLGFCALSSKNTWPTDIWSIDIWLTDIWPTDIWLADILAEWHLADWHLADWHLANWHLADWHLANWHLADWYLGDSYLADWHLAYWHFGRLTFWPTDIWPMHIGCKKTRQLLTKWQDRSCF
jgi:hypothetical protein